MGLSSFFKDKEDDLLNRYKRLRGCGRTLNHILAKQLGKTDIHECAKKLGLLKGSMLVLGSEDEVSVLFDYCLYNHRRGRKNVIERYLEDSPPPVISDEMLLLKAMTNSYYSLFSVDEVQTGKGVMLHDLLHEKQVFLMDIGMGQSAKPGFMFAGRVLPLADFHMSSGASIPVEGEGARQEIMLILRKFLKNKKKSDVFLSPSQEAAFSAQIIRVLLRAGALEHMMYRDDES